MADEKYDLDQINAILAANSFKHFVKLFWGAVSQDNFVDGYHVDAICDHLQAVYEGRCPRLVINVAVRHSKSLLVSVLFPVWVWLRWPSCRIITATYSKELTVRDAVRSRHLIESPLFQRYYGGIFSLTDDTNRKDFYSNDAGGHRLSASVGSRTAGFDADLIVADDIADMATRNSQADRDTTADYFETALCSRLVLTGREAIVVAGHRLHEDDLYARLRAKYGDDGSWSWLVLPEEFSPKFSEWHNSTGWRDRRQEGDLLWPERFSAAQLQQERKRYRHEFSAIFLQEPTPAEGSLFKSEWFRHYTTDGESYFLCDRRVSKSQAWRFCTVDTAISTAATADWTVAQVWDVIGRDLILVHQLRKRLDGTRIVPALGEIYRSYRPQFLAVESEFVGRFVMDQLRQANVPVKPFSAKKHGPKETRSVAAEIRLESGQVWFPADAPWLADIERELLSFPNGSNDDCVDCASMACLLSERYLKALEPELSPEEQVVQEQEKKRKHFLELLNQGCPW